MSHRFQNTAVVLVLITLSAFTSKSEPIAPAPNTQIVDTNLQEGTRYPRPDIQPDIKDLGKVEKDTINEIMLGTKKGNDALLKFGIKPDSLLKVEVLSSFRDPTKSQSGCSKMCFPDPTTGAEVCIMTCGMVAASPSQPQPQY